MCVTKCLKETQTRQVFKIKNIFHYFPKQKSNAEYTALQKLKFHMVVNHVTMIVDRYIDTR